MPNVAAIVAAVLALSLASVPVERPAKPSREVAARSSGQLVTVKGRIWKRKGTVRIQRRSHGHWKNLRRAKVRKHRFKVKVRQKRKVARYRAAKGKRHSRTFTVRVRHRHTTAPVPQGPSASPPPFPLDLAVNLLGGLAAPTTDSTPPAVASEPTDACGVQPVKSDGSRWACTFAADFSGSQLNRSKWLPQTNFTMGGDAAHACYVDSPDNIAVRDGTLQLTVRRADPPVPCGGAYRGTTSPYSGGSVMTYRLFSQRYGRFEARIKVEDASVPGLHEAFWLWPDDRFPSTAVWPAAGEIDIVETYSQYPSLAIPFLHYTAYDNWGPIPGVNTAWTCAARRGVFNTYTLEWSPQRLRILVNGHQCLVNSSGDPAFQKPYIIALTAGLGVDANALTARTPLPATTVVDYVRVWK